MDAQELLVQQYKHLRQIYFILGDILTSAVCLYKMFQAKRHQRQRQVKLENHSASTGEHAQVDFPIILRSRPRIAESQSNFWHSGWAKHLHGCIVARRSPPSMSRKLTDFWIKASSGKIVVLLHHLNYCVKRRTEIWNIIPSRVDQPDVDLDEEDAPAVEDDAPEEAMETNAGDQEPNKKQFKLSYEKYKKISFLIIEHIRFVCNWNCRNGWADLNVPGGKKQRQSLRRMRKMRLQPKAR